MGDSPPGVLEREHRTVGNDLGREPTAEGNWYKSTPDRDPRFAPGKVGTCVERKDRPEDAGNDVIDRNAKMVRA